MGAQQLAGKRALVTGGSRGIGAAIVSRLAQDGADVAFTYAAAADTADKLRSDIAARGGTAVALRAESADPHKSPRRWTKRYRGSVAWTSW